MNSAQCGQRHNKCWTIQPYLVHVNWKRQRTSLVIKSTFPQISISLIHKCKLMRCRLIFLLMELHALIQIYVACVCVCETSADGKSVKPLACCVSVKLRSLSHYGDSSPAKSPLTCQENKYPVPHYSPLYHHGLYCSPAREACTWQ